MVHEKFCQSCGMPLSEESLYATNANQNKNDDYCIHCFKDGKFTDDCSMEEMIEISLKHMSELFADDPNYNADEARANMQSFFPQLKRWQS